MQIQQGSCLSLLGLVNIDENGKCTMTNLMAVLAGGLKEALRLIKSEKKQTTILTWLFSGLSLLSFFAAGSYAYYNNLKKMQAQQLKDSLEKASMDRHKMPTVRAETMGTLCNICYENPCNIVLIPCNHLCICSDCFEKIKKPENGAKTECPTCKQTVDPKHQVLIIYDGKPLTELEMKKKSSSVRIPPG